MATAFGALQSPLGGNTHAARLHILALGFLLSLSGASRAASISCLDDGKPPPAALTGTLKEGRLVGDFPYSSPTLRKPFYVLDLEEPICLKGAFSNAVVSDIRSIHVYSLDPAKLAKLRKYGGRRVSVKFASVFEAHTAHHRRPMVGEVESVVALK